jgi:hypothetical protein
MAGFNENSFFEGSFSKKHLQQLRSNVIEINLLQKNEEPITMTYKDGIVLFGVHDGDQENEIVCSSVQQADSFVASRIADLKRFEESKKEQKTKDIAFLNNKKIKTIIDSLNANNRSKHKYSYIISDSSEEIKLIENDETIIPFKNFKEFNKWVWDQLEKRSITNPEIEKLAIASIVDDFNTKNQDKNIIIEATKNPDETITVSFLHAKTKQKKADDKNFKNINALLDWIERIK